jgi:alpha-glucoside transport system permease protein
MSSTQAVTPVPVQLGKDATVVGSKTGRSRKHDPSAKSPIWVRIVLIVICLMWIIPTFGLALTSFRPQDDAASSGWWTVLTTPAKLTTLTLKNYGDLFTQADMGTAFINSLVISVPATIIPILIAAFAAYAFTFMTFPGRDLLLILIVALLVVPTQVALVPLLKLYGQLGISGTFLAIWLAHIGFGMSLAVYLIRNYMATLPREVIESAKIDDLLNALIFIGPGPNQPLTIALVSLLGQQGQGWQLLTAGGLFTMLLPIIVFLSLQRYFVRGLTAGSVKG